MTCFSSNHLGCTDSTTGQPRVDPPAPTTHTHTHTHTQAYTHSQLSTYSRIQSLLGRVELTFFKTNKNICDKKASL